VSNQSTAGVHVTPASLPGPYHSADIPGTGGVLKQQPEDFVVEEIPAYDHSGEGEHLYLWVEKRDLSTPHMLRMLAKAFRMRERDIGYAGLKDRDAVTRQWISMYLKGRPALEAAEELADRFEHSNIKILRRTRHGNKLKIGHLRGNRFHIVVRNVDDSATDENVQRIANLLRGGAPNYFGCQRFGVRMNGADTARLFMLGRWAEAFESLWPGVSGGEVSDDRNLEKRRNHFRHGRWKLLMDTMPRAALRVVLSSYQSMLFNRFVAAHLKDMQRVYAGQIMCRMDNGALFMAEDAAVEQQRCDALEISPTGPLYGPKMMWSQGMAGQWEQEIFASQDCSLEVLGRPAPGFNLQGDRRAMRMIPHNLAVQLDKTAGTLHLSFDLHSGSYATVILREFMKNAAPDSPKIKE